MQEIKLRFMFILMIGVFYLGSCETSQEEHKEYYETGELRIKGSVENNSRVGEWIVYDKFGGVSKKLFYKNDSLYKRLTFVEGNLKMEEQLIDSVRNGVLKIYYENGNVQSMKTFKNGEEEGLTKEFYPDGTLRVSFVRLEDKVTNFRQFFSNGELFVEAENLDNGINHFSDSLGNRTFDVLYKNGEIVDTLKSYQ